MYVAAKTAAWVLLFYCVFFLAACIVEQVDSGKHKNVYLIRDYRYSIYATDVNYAAYGLAGLDDYPKQIFILGASVPELGFVPDRLMSELHGYKVNNLCLGASNISETAQLVKLIEQRVDLARLDQPIFVIGGHFASFLENQRKFKSGITDLQKEFVRFRLYRVSGDFVTPIWGGRRTAIVAGVLLKPFILIYKIKVLLTDELGQLVRSKVLQRLQVSARFYRTSRERQFHYRGFTSDQFEKLNELIKGLEARGAKVVFVYMPVPDYFRNDFAIYDEYRKRTSYLAERKDIQVLDMSGFAPDASFRDDAHPVAAAAVGWSDALAAFMKKKVLSRVQQ
jgi:hypothetical protein